MIALHPRTETIMAATLSRARMVGVLLLTVLTPSALVGQSSTPDPWREFPSYDVLIAMRLREGADAEEAERLLAQAPASVDTFTKLVRAKRLDDALVVLKPQLLSDADARIKMTMEQGGNPSDLDSRANSYVLDIRRIRKAAFLSADCDSYGDS